MNALCPINDDQMPAVVNAPAVPMGANPNLWITAGELAVLVGISERKARESLKKATHGKSWRGAVLAVREIKGTRGNGGKTYQVHVDSLPRDVRALWWASQGVDVYATPPVPMANKAVMPEVMDKDFAHKLPDARWKLAIIEPILSLHDKDRAAAIANMVGQEMVQPDGSKLILKRATLYLWLKKFEEHGLQGLTKQSRSNKGVSFVKVTQAWDIFFADKISTSDHDEVQAVIYRYIRSLWAGGENGWRMISEKSTSRLHELTADLGVKGFDILDKGRINDRTNVNTQYGLCYLNRRRIEAEKTAMIVAIRDKDAKQFHDIKMPRIKRDYSRVKPMEMIVGDVHPMDVKCWREDGSAVWPKAICWLDVGTNRLWVTLVACEENEGIKQMHVAQSFSSMCNGWGLPNSLYLDNGSEYKWAEMMDGFVMLSKLTRSFKLMALEAEPDLLDYAKSKIHRSRPYNAAGKPKIEGVFSLLEQGHLRLIDGWVGGERMRQKTHNVGKAPEGFKGAWDEFHDHVDTVLEHYHRRGQSGHLKGLSPYEALNAWIDKGWEAAAVDQEVMMLTFAEEAHRKVDRGTIQFNSIIYYHDDLLPFSGQSVLVRVGKHDPSKAFIMDGNDLLCVAVPEIGYAPYDRAGAKEQGRRAKIMNRHVAEVKRNVDRLDLIEETARHNAHLAGAPDIPFGDRVSAPVLEQMIKAANDADELTYQASKRDKPKKLTQFGEDKRIKDSDVKWLNEAEGV